MNSKMIGFLACTSLALLPTSASWTPEPDVFSPFEPKVSAAVKNWTGRYIRLYESIKCKECEIQEWGETKNKKLDKDAKESLYSKLDAKTYDFEVVEDFVFKKSEGKYPHPKDFGKIKFVGYVPLWVKGKTAKLAKPYGTLETDTEVTMVEIKGDCVTLDVRDPNNKPYEVQKSDLKPCRYIRKYYTLSKTEEIEKFRIALIKVKKPTNQQKGMVVKPFRVVKQMMWPTAKKEMEEKFSNLPKKKLEEKTRDYAGKLAEQALSKNKGYKKFSKSELKNCAKAYLDQRAQVKARLIKRKKTKAKKSKNKKPEPKESNIPRTEQPYAKVRKQKESKRLSVDLKEGSARTKKLDQSPRMSILTNENQQIKKGASTNEQAAKKDMKPTDTSSNADAKPKRASPAEKDRNLSKSSLSQVWDLAKNVGNFPVMGQKFYETGKSLISGCYSGLTSWF